MPTLDLGGEALVSVPTSVEELGINTVRAISRFRHFDSKIPWQILHHHSHYSFGIWTTIVAHRGMFQAPKLVFIHDLICRCRYIAVARNLTSGEKEAWQSSASCGDYFSMFGACKTRPYAVERGLWTFWLVGLCVLGSYGCAQCGRCISR